MAAVAQAADEPCLAKIFFANDASSTRLPGITVEDHHPVVSLRINENKEDLRFVFDTGAGRTVLNRAVAQRLGLQATAKGSLGGRSVTTELPVQFTPVIASKRPNAFAQGYGTTSH
jgi:Aspartyl protease